MCGEIAKFPYEKINMSQIDDLEENLVLSKKLNTAIWTIQKHNANRFRFVKLNNF